ncbi:hypothetical protein RE428_08330 [Marinobacter nanhaiticus D15-8W]|uniref:Uncharacterized protein n=2 Tax=Marinobacter TaxID=2742 RepID=N6VWB6_9GAMM|nr:hypothetical protein J057_04321 [Marinobacter nanhaiticus D15-8W]BES69815.1 hypothetical protein RE428_08330 [Marinobacter nanhaiticus D15-8W]
MLVGASLLASPAFAEQEDAGKTFREGVIAFQGGDLQRSRELLEQAAAMGYAASALHYNLGVVYYRLERYGRAETAFERLLDTPHRDLARYNLGLIAKATGRAARADRLFLEVANTATESNLRVLARRQLDLQKGPVDHATSWLLFASAGLGYEENLSLLPDTAASEDNDTYHELVLYTRGPLMNLDADMGSESRIEAQASYYQRHYHHDRPYNTDALKGGVSWYVDDGNASRRVGVDQVYFWADSASRETHTGLYGDWRWGTCTTGVSGRCQLKAEITRVHPFEGYEAYRGMRYNALGRYRADWGDWRGSASYELELNAREDFSTYTQYVDVSPARHKFELGVDYVATRNLLVGGALEYRLSRYEDAYRFPAGSTFESGERSDDRYAASLQMEYAFLAAWSVVLDATYERNESSLSQYSYENRSYQLTLSYFLP